MVESNRQVGQVRIYGCGGAGIKVAARFDKECASEEGFAQHHCCYIDTSHSDLLENIDAGNSFLFSDIDGCEDVDGAGQIRADIVDVVRPHINQILQKFTPCDLNIVIAGTAGGSGSVISPLLAHALIERGESVIVLTITSTQSKRAVSNTIDTLQTFEKLAEHASAPLILSLANNGARVHSEEVDQEIMFHIASLLGLYSRQHQRLDLSDLRSWSNFHKATSVDAQLVTLHICDSAEKAKAIPYPIAIASLVPEGHPANLGGTTAEYLCEGWHNTADTEQHFVLTNGTLGAFFRDLVQTKDEMEKASAARPKTSGLGGKSSDGGFLVL